MTSTLRRRVQELGRFIYGIDLVVVPAADPLASQDIDERTDAVLDYCVTLGTAIVDRCADEIVFIDELNERLDAVDYALLVEPDGASDLICKYNEWKARELPFWYIRFSSAIATAICGASAFVAGSGYWVPVTTAAIGVVNRAIYARWFLESNQRILSDMITS